MANDGGYAYPSPADRKAGWKAESGMSFRDAAAIGALQVVGPYMSTYMPEKAAKVAYDLAQAMVDEKAARDGEVNRFEPRDVRQGLILFRSSNNASSWTNCISLSEEIEKLPPPAKVELANTMQNIAFELLEGAEKP